MNTAAESERSEHLLALVHQCISGALQFDYLSSGTQRPGAPAPKPRVKSATNSSTASQGRDIARQYLAEIAARRRLSSREEYCLATAARKGSAAARRQLIEHHLGLVVLLARPYGNRGLPLLDLLAEGNIGLLTAVGKFDPERGYRFSTYAKWWVRQSIELALMTQTNTVRVPIHVTRALKQRSKARASRNGVPASDEETRFLLHDVRHHGASAHAAHDEELQAIVDGIAAPEHEQPDWHVHTLTRSRNLQAALERLKDTERLVLEARFGLSDDVDYTLQEVAHRLHLSSERVRQIQGEALRKLAQILKEDNADERLL